MVVGELCEAFETCCEKKKKDRARLKCFAVTPEYIDSCMIYFIPT